MELLVTEKLKVLESPDEEDVRTHNFKIKNNQVVAELDFGAKFVGLYDKKNKTLNVTFVKQIDENNFEEIFSRAVKVNCIENIIEKSSNVDIYYVLTLKE